DGPVLTAALVHNLAEARQPFIFLSGLFIAGWAVVIISFLVLTRYVNANLVQPVLELSRTADDIRHGRFPDHNFRAMGQGEGGNEISALFRSFYDMVSSLQDAKLQAQQAENRFRSLYENSVEGIFQVDREDRLLSANPALAHMLGWQSPEAMQRELHGKVRLVYADESQREQVKQLLRTHDRLLDYEVRLVRRDGSEMWSALSARTVRDDSGAILHYEGSVLDISERKKREHAERLQQSAEAASQAKSRFLATMSHEIRTPLNAILGMADLLWETSLSMEQRDYVRIFRSSGELLLSLINDILDLSRIESGRFALDAVDFDLREIVDKTGETLAATAQTKGLELVCRMAPGVPSQVSGDPIRLRQVLFNLLGNAVKFTAQGDVLLQVEHIPDQGEQGVFEFTVRDTGIGIPEDKLRIIFDRFSQADDSMIRRYGGSGLGLAIAKRLVAIMGGEIRVQSAPGEGSAFTCSIPLPIKPDQPAPFPEQATTLAGLKVLVVEPHPQAREALLDFLAPLNIQPVCADDPDQARQAAKDALEQEAPFGLALLESRLQDGDGAQLAADLAAIHPGLPAVLMVPVTASLAERERARAAGLWSMLVKPVRLDKLINAFCEVGRCAGPACADPPNRKAAPGQEGLRILLADDSDNNRLLIRHFFKYTNHLLLEAANGQQAVDIYAKTPVDLVLMDLEMPLMDGYAATQAIREMEADRGQIPVPIIALTAHAFTEVRDKCLAVGCTDFLTKPVPKKVLLQRIDHFIPVAGPKAT
ncbi:MAG: response regulator, partial [Desulfovibrionaceae bacterium]